MLGIIACKEPDWDAADSFLTELGDINDRDNFQSIAVVFWKRTSENVDGGWYLEAYECYPSIIINDIVKLWGYSHS